MVARRGSSSGSSRHCPGVRAVRYQPASYVEVATRARQQQPRTSVHSLNSSILRWRQSLVLEDSSLCTTISRLNSASVNSQKRSFSMLPLDLMLHIPYTNAPVFPRCSIRRITFQRALQAPDNSIRNQSMQKSERNCCHLPMTQIQNFSSRICLLCCFKAQWNQTPCRIRDLSSGWTRPGGHRRAVVLTL